MTYDSILMLSGLVKKVYEERERGEREREILLFVFDINRKTNITIRNAHLTHESTHDKKYLNINWYLEIISQIPFYSIISKLDQMTWDILIM